MDLNEKRALIYLNDVDKFSSLRIKEIIDKYGSARSFLNSSKKTAYQNIKIPKNIIFYNEEFYPNLLKHINDNPLFIYFAGNKNILKSNKFVSIVGTRNVTPYGVRLAKKITKDYIDSDYVVVSGLAKGVDTIVHQTCIENNSPTIAVLGTPVDQPYPKENIELYKNILNNGCIISESTIYQGYSKWMFPRRNRIIAGLSSEIIVIEAKEKSGALITAEYAFQYNRKLIAVPGSVFSENSLGCHKLINQNKAEIYIEKSASNTNSISDIAKSIIDYIDKGFNTLDLIIGQSNVPEHIIKTQLNFLESRKIIAKDFFDSYIVLD